MPHADNLSRALLALILLCLVVGNLRDSGDSSPEPNDAVAETAALRTHGERYSIRMIGLQRKPPLMLRADSATGEAWMLDVVGAGPWEALREGPEGVPSAGADEAGRYEFQSVMLRRGAPTLVRTDLRTGRVWRKGSTSRGSWVAVPNPGEEPLKAAKSTAMPTAKPAAAAPSTETDDEPDAQEGLLEAEEAAAEGPGDVAD
jgi:hypothetical protein